MKKNLLFATLFCITGGIYAQHNFTAVPKSNYKGISQHSPGGAAACDTLNLDEAAADWSAFYYTYGSDGYVFGTSDLSAFGYTIMEDANYFDVSAKEYSYISGGAAFFAFANSNVAANLDKDVVFKVYDDAAGLPGTELGSVSLKLSQIHDDVLAGNLTEFLFPAPIPLPASKTFYVSIDHSAFKWNSNTHDSIAIVANADDETANAAFQYLKIVLQGNQWVAVNDFWSSSGNPLDVSLYIFPYVSKSIDGCVPMPVNILNFTGTVKSNQVYLTWSTATELNNKGFEIQRSKDGQNFSTIGFVSGAGNSNQVRNYSYTDAATKEIAGSKNYYRLKQVDFDGKSTYSKVVSLTLDDLHFWKLYPNPVKDKLTIELTLTELSKVSIQVISHDGKVVMSMDKGSLQAGSQVISFDTKALASGSYLIRLNANDQVYSQHIIKQ